MTRSASLAPTTDWICAGYDENPSLCRGRGMTLQDWIIDSILGKSSRWWVRYLAASLITLLSIFIVVVLWRRLGAIADPSLILLLTVAAATYLAGGMAGTLSAALRVFFSFVGVSHP